MDPATANSENAGFLLNDFLKSLEEKDFSIDIDDHVVANQINNLFLNKDLTVEQTKYSLAAIICRNAEEQQKFYQLFEDYIKKKIKEKELINEIKEQLKIWIKQKKIILFTFISVDIILLILFFLCLVPISKTQQYVGEKKPIETSGHFTTDKTVSLSVLNRSIKNYTHAEKKWDSKQTIYQSRFEPTYDTTGLKVVWDLQDTIIKDKKNIQYQFKSPGKKNIAIRFLYGKTIKRTYKDSIYICEPSPDIRIPDAVFVNEKTTFTAVSAKDKSLKWTLDGQDTITKNNVLEHTFTERGNHNISCKIQGQQCIHDGSKAIDNKSFDVIDKEVFTVNKKPDTLYISPYSTSLTKFFYCLLGIASLFLLCCLLTLFVPYIYSLYTKIISDYFNVANRKKAENYFKDSTEPIFTGDKSPIDIRFYNKDRLIKSKQNIRKLSFDLQKKVATEDSKINLKHTIKASIRNFDLLTPIYENKNTKRCYLFLIDVSNPKNTQVKLFAFLINHLKKNQVELDVYYYFRDPIRVFKRDVDDSVDIKILKNKYYQSVLIVFSDGYNFLDANAPEIHLPIHKEYSYWTKRVLVTPTPSLDWSVNEKILASFFHIVAADSSGLLSIFSMLEKGVYDQKVVNTKDYNSYESKFIEFEDIKSLKAFLVNKEMFQWVCAIAVYPKITWEIILTIGETINPANVTYENLLKISRIKWMQNGNLPTRIRLELLKNLDHNYEVEVRKSIIKLLEEESKRDDSSFSNNERIIQLIYNKFILFSYNPKTFALYEKEEKEFLRLYQDEKFMDIALKVYLQGVDPDKKDSWKSLMKESSEKGINNLEYYYNTKTNTTPQHFISKNIKKYLRAGSLFFLIMVSALAFIGTIKPNIDLFVNKQKLVPYECIIKLNIDECYKTFNPVKLIISDKGKIIYNSTLTEKDNNIPLKLIFEKEIFLKFISYKNDTISSVIKVQQPTSIVRISGLYCKRINAVFHGKNYEKYKDILEKSPLKTKNYIDDQVPNSIVFSSEVDSSFIYKLCLDLINKNFPLQEITMDKDFKYNKLQKNDEEIIFSTIKTKNSIITTVEELNTRFYKKVSNPKIYLQYNSKSLKDSMNLFYQKLINSKFENVEKKLDNKYAEKSEVRYFYDTDKSKADELAILASNFFGQKISSKKLTLKPVKQIEVWIKKDVRIICKPIYSKLYYLLYFEKGKAILNQESQDVINSLVNTLIANANYKVSINAYANYATQEYNMALASKYSNSIKSYLDSRGINTSSFLIKNYGLNSKEDCGNKVEIEIMPINTLVDENLIKRTVNVNNDTKKNTLKTKIVKILWVDDHHLENNLDIIQKLRENDITIDTVGTNMEALKMISNKNYDFIITDIGRNNDEIGVRDKNQAGVEFTYDIKDKSKIIIFSPVETIKRYQSELLKNGVTHFYSDFNELENYIFTALKYNEVKK